MHSSHPPTATHKGTKRPEPPYEHDYSYDQDTCPDCGEDKRRASKRCRWCDVLFRRRIAENIKQAIETLKSNGKEKLVFSIPPNELEAALGRRVNGKYTYRILIESD